MKPATIIDGKYADEKSEHFIKTVRKELTVFQETYDNSALLFPPLTSYYRFLLHQTVTDNFLNQLFTFSVGDGDQRRVIVGRQTGLRKPSPSSFVCASAATGAAGIIVKSKHGDKKAAHKPAGMSSESSDSPDEFASRFMMRQRRPDRQMYIPKPKRVEEQVRKKTSLSSDSSNRCQKGASCQRQFSGSTSSSPSPDGIKSKTTLTNDSLRLKCADKTKFTTNFNGVIFPETGSGDASTKAGTQPVQRKAPLQSNRLPSQVIEQMLKRHNIDVPVPVAAVISASDGSVEEVGTVTVAKPNAQNGETVATPPIATLSGKADNESAILNCLPSSYQDFLIEEITYTMAAKQQLCTLTAAANPTDAVLCNTKLPHSQQELSAVPESLHSSTRASPSLDADDLEVRMINESFEESQKQLRLFGSDEVKRAFYSRPNPDLSRADAEKEKDPSLPGEPLTDDGSSSNSGVHSVQSMEDTKSAPVKVSDEQSTASGKLTWAGWGKKCEGDQDTNLTIEISHEDEVSNSKDLISWSPPSESPFKRSPLQSVTSDLLNESFVEAFTSKCSVKPAASDDKDDLVAMEQNTKDLDMLSAAMIEQVLSGDDGDDGLFSEKTLPSKDELLVQSLYEVTPSSMNSGKPARTASVKQAPPSKVVSDEGCSTGASSDVMAESWEDLLDDTGDLIDAQVLRQAQRVIGNASIKSTRLDYFPYSPKCVDINESDFSHVVEVYGIPPHFKGDDLHMVLSQLHCGEFHIEWIDGTHALAAFASAAAVQKILDRGHAMVKFRTISNASSNAKAKLKSHKDNLQPHKKRPQTTAYLARRLVEAHLGKKSQVIDEQRNRERTQLQCARDKKRLDAQRRDDMWEGRI